MPQQHALVLDEPELSSRRQGTDQADILRVVTRRRRMLRFFAAQQRLCVTTSCVDCRAAQGCGTCAARCRECSNASRIDFCVDERNAAPHQSRPAELGTAKESTARNSGASAKR